MRESNFSFPLQNKACIVLTSAFYDRRALDCTSTLPLINSLSHLTFLTSTSPRIREILSVDGGLERLIFLLKTPRGKDSKCVWLWTLVLQCLVNIGVRGSESIRTRVVEADIVPVVASILQYFHSALELALAERGKEKRFMRELSHQRAAIAPAPPPRNTDPEMHIRAPLRPVPMRRVSPTIPPPSNSPVRPSGIAEPVHVSVRRHHSSASVSSDDSRSLTSTRSHTPTDDIQNATASLNIDSSLGRHAYHGSNVLQVRPVLRHQSSTVSVADSDDGNSDDVASTIGDTGANELAIHDSIDGRLVLSDDEPTSLAGLSNSMEQIVGQTDATAQTITIARPSDTELAPSGPTTIGRTVRSRSDTNFHPAVEGNLAANSSQVEYKSTSLPREDDIILALQLFAYISKYPNLRTYFAESYYVNDLFSSPTPCFDKQTQVSCNVFSLVEKFTLRIHPQEVQYWAGVIMRNACRKDESRGGVRQCANMKCGKWEEYSRQFAKCRRCRRTKYCSKSCQSQAWPGHRWWCVQRNEDRSEPTSHMATEIQAL